MKTEYHTVVERTADLFDNELERLTAQGYTVLYQPAVVPDESKQSQSGFIFTALMQRIQGVTTYAAHAIDFAKWYSAMDQDKIVSAYNRWLEERTTEDDTEQRGANEFPKDEEGK